MKYLALALLAGSAHAAPLWLEPPPNPTAIERPTIAPLVARARAALLVIETPAPALPSGHPAVPGDQLHGRGSGVIIHPSGLAISNQHVVDCGTELRAQVGTDPTWHPIRVLAQDAAADLALLQIGGARSDWPALPLGDSRALRLGDFVVALGHPFGLTHSVSLGILSGRGRAPSSSDRLTVPYDYLQTDAAINPGNSGGPLLDLSGAIIGLNTAIHARAQGIGFAIPSAAIKRVLPALQSQGYFSAGWMGIRIGDDPTGVVVLDVQPDAAAHGHLRAGDVITRIDTRPVRVAHDLQVATRLAGGGETVTLQIIREAQPETVQMVLGQAPRGADPCAVKAAPTDARLPMFRAFEGIFDLAH